MLPLPAGRKDSPLLSQASRWRWFCATIVFLAAWLPTGARAAGPASSRQLVCQTVEQTAAASGLPSGFLARLLWIESRYHESATSPAGALGIAQFMPQTAARRGLADPRDPLKAIAEAARLLADLKARFGNLGLAAAAYNAGAERVAAWLRGGTDLARETQLYVLDITGRRVADWALLPSSASGAYDAALSGFDCLNAGVNDAAASPKRPTGQPWQARLAVKLARAIDLFRASNERAARSDPRVRSNESYTATRREANSLCETLRASGAACEVFDP